MHFVGPDQFHGFEERLTTDIYPADFGWTPDWDQAEERQNYFHSVSTVVEAGLCTRSLQLDYDEDASYQAERWLYDAVRSKDDRPFFLCASFTHPHDPYTTTAPYWARYDDVKIDLPSVPALSFEEHDPHSRRLHYNYRCDEFDLNDDVVRNARRAYYGNWQLYRRQGRPPAPGLGGSWPGRRHHHRHDRRPRRYAGRAGALVQDDLL